MPNNIWQAISSSCCVGTSPQENFNEVRSLALTYLKAIIVEARRLRTLSGPESGFDFHINKLGGLESKLKGASKANLQDQDLEIISNFTNHILGHPKFGDKLIQHYNLATEYAKAAYLTNNIEIIPKIMNAVKGYADVDTLTDDIYVELLNKNRARKEANKPKDISILDITGSMILWIAKRETLSYVIKGLLEETIKKLELQNYDLDQICSLEDKVETGSDKKTGAITGYTSDVIAIRYCIAHARYRIRKSNEEGYTLEFEWKQKYGWNFYKRFTGTEFLDHTKKYIFFEEMQATLLIIAMCEGLMTLHLQKK
jgi:hypothetical protein